MKKQVTFLGHVVSNKVIQPDPVNSEKVMTWPTPTNVTQVKGTVAFGSYYRRFVKDFAKLVKPLIHNLPDRYNRTMIHDNVIPLLGKFTKNKLKLSGFIVQTVRNPTVLEFLNMSTRSRDTVI